MLYLGSSPNVDMIKKHLTAAAWEATAKKSKLDPKPLARALAAFEDCEEDDFDDQEKTLAEIKKTAASLEGDKEYKEAAKYLGKVGDAAADELKDVLQRKKDEEEDEKEEGGDADLGKALVTALNTVKSLGAPAPGDESFKPMKFVACVATGGCAVIVSRKAGSSAKKKTTALAGSGGKYYQGDCIFENTAHTFVMEAPASGLAKRFSKALFDATGQKFKVRVRSYDGSFILDDETDTEPVGEVKPVDPTKATPKNQTAAPKEPPPEFKERLAKLAPKLKELIAAQNDKSESVKAIAAKIAELAKAGNYAAALSAIQRLEAAFGQETPVKEPGNELRERWLQMYAEHIPGYEEAIDRDGGSTPEADEIIRKLQLAWNWAESQAEAGSYEKAIAALQRIAPLFDQAVAAKEKGVVPDEGELVRQRQFLLRRWRQIPGELHAEVAKLEQQIAATMPEEDAEELGALTNDYLDDFLFGLNDEVNNSINAGNVAGLSALKQKVSGDPLFAHLHGTPFVDGKVFQGIVIAAIDEITKNLSK